MKIEIAHLYDYPKYFRIVAQWIHEEWWLSKPGHSVDTMEARLRQASNPQEIPLSLVALANARPVGTVNLVENDDESRPHLFPWLAALLVLPQYRGRGIGSKLVCALLEEARRLKIKQMYLGTDAPGFYMRFGAAIHEQVVDDYCIMRLNMDV
jgi:predicted N-acetyltransferase YhbS